MKALLVVLALTVFASPGMAQSHPCDATPAVPVILAGQKFGVGFCSNVVDYNGYQVTLDGVVQPDLGPGGGKSEAASATGFVYYETPLALTAAQGAHTLVVRVRDAGGTFGTPSTVVSFTVGAGTGTAVNCVVSAWSAVAWSPWTAVSATTETRTGTQTRTVTTPASGGGTACPALTLTTTESRPITQTGQECVAPFGVEAVSIAVTRWEPLTGRVPRPGAEARVNYRLTSRSPVRSIAVKVDGAVVKEQRSADVDLTGDGGQWFTVPATAGTYKLSVAAANERCPTPREVLSPVDLTVR